MQPASTQRLGKHTSAQAQWRHIPSRDLFSVLSVRRLYNEDLFKLKLVESPGGFSSWEYKEENGAWFVKIEYRLEQRSTEWLKTRRLRSDLKW
jgi:hypothetical protein